MKRNILLFLLIIFFSMSKLFSQPCFSLKDGLFDLIYNNKLIFEITAKSELSVYCQRELGWYNPKINNDCIKTAIKTVDLLDISYSSGITYFSLELEELMKKSETNKYIDDLIKFIRYLNKNPNLKANLWDWTLKHSSINGSKKKALKYLAVLLQDVSVTMMHVQKKSGQNYEKLKELLSMFEDTEEVRENLELYPSYIKNKTIGLYHFYVIAYLAKKLKEQNTSGGMAFILPYLLNRTYELYDHKGKDIRLLLPTRTKIPEDFYSDNSAMTDTYLGYAGAFWGATFESNNNFSLIESFSEFSKKISKDPHKFSKEKYSILE